MAVPLDSAWRKLARGKKHVEDLNVELKRFYKSDPYDGVIETDPDVPENSVWKVKLTKPIPGVLAEIMGDAAGNLRAALDHAVYAVAVASGRVNPSQAYFPFCRGTASEFENNIKGRCRDVPQEIWPLFRRFQPYKGGNHFLWALNEICVSDKHKMLTPVCGGSLRWKASVMATGFWRMPNPIVWDRSKNEMVLLVAHTGAIGKHDFEFTLFVAFNEISAVDGQPVDRVFNELVSIVEGVLLGIEVEARRLGYVQ